MKNGRVGKRNPRLHREEPRPLPSPAFPHRVHDYRFLIHRWRNVARTAGLRLRRLAVADGAPAFYLQTGDLSSGRGIYISAGIHGDEPAGAEGLIAWAEQNAARLRSLPLLIFPCLNPWGLVNNSRFDAQGADLNRAFHLDSQPVIAALKALIAGRRFTLALHLHEDFEGQGFYLYEVQRERPFWGEALLDVVRPIMPIEPRVKVDGRKADAGLIRRRFETKRFEQMGFPEAIHLHMHHAQRALTIETPSEFAIEKRVAAQVAVIEECVRRCLE